MRKYIPIAIAVLAGLVITSVPLEAAPAPVSNAQLEIVLKAREKRADLLHDEINALDSRIESGVDSIVGALREIGDSKDSRTKVARMKEQTIEALKKNIAYYQSKRATLQEELRRPTLLLTEEQKRKAIDAFDKRIEKRIAQILEVQKSLPGHKDYERYVITGSNWYGTTRKENEDFRQNQRVTAHTNSQRAEIVNGLRQSIAKLEQQNKALKAQGAPKEEMARNDAFLVERRQQLAAALSPNEGSTREVGLKEAVDLDKALQTAISDLRGDFNTLFARYSAYLQELAAVNAGRNAMNEAKVKAS